MALKIIKKSEPVVEPAVQSIAPSAEPPMVPLPWNPTVLVRADLAPRPQEPQQVKPPPIPQSQQPNGASTILSELQALVDGRYGTLMLMSRKTGEGFRVMDCQKVGDHIYQTRLVGPGGMELRPRITQNELDKYDPLWR